MTKRFPDAPRVGDWLRLRCGDFVRERDGRHIGRVEAILARGNTQEDIQRLKLQVVDGNLAGLQPDATNVAIGSRLARGSRKYESNCGGPATVMRSAG